MGESNPKRSGWIYVGAAIALCLLALLLFRALGQSFAPDPFAVKLEDLLDETPDLTALDGDGFAFPSLPAFCSALKDTGIAVDEMESGGATAVYALSGEGLSGEDRLVCSFNGAGNVVSFTIEMPVAEKPKAVTDRMGSVEKDLCARLLEQHQAFLANMSFALSSCMKAFGLEQALSYAARDRMDAVAQASVAEQKAAFLEEGAFRFGVLFKELGGKTSVHLSIERIAKSAKGDGAS